MDNYGVYETNPLSTAQREAQNNAKRKVDWDEDGLTITRLRLVSDPGFPAWDVSYCFGVMKDGEVVSVRLPFSQLPKYGKGGYKAALFREAKATGKFIKGLFDAVSTLN